MTGFLLHAGRQQQHKGMVWGVYVQPAARGQGVAKRLMQAVIAHARTVEVLAILPLGFEVSGVERHALRLASGLYMDEELRMLELRALSVSPA